MKSHLWIPCFVLVLVPLKVDGQTVSATDRQFFEKNIRPVLVKHCYQCHSSQNKKKLRGGLALDTREGLRKGGDSGPIIVPGKPAESLLLKALSHKDAELAMPPSEKLDADIIVAFAEWVRRGAPDPRDDGWSGQEIDIAKGRKHWSFQSPKNPIPPKIKQTNWPRTDIDRFILAELDNKGLQPNSDAERRILLRRLSFDLIGLPPTPAEVEAFLADKSAKAYENVVDQLLASPRFGEKWARHWLDLARYAESTGKTVNFYYPHAWRYRDYVIAAFNSDKPYDQFIMEQLAGDLMPTEDANLRAERMIATGFLAIGPKTLNERSGLKYELDNVDEQIDVTTQAFLGITVACARCHDHKFDPIPQADYYALAGIFRSTESCYGTVRYINAQRTTPVLDLPKDSKIPAGIAPLSARERQRVENQIQSVRDSMKNSRDGLQIFFSSGRLALLQAKLDAYHDDGTPKLLAMGVRDKPLRRRFGIPRRRFGDYTYDGQEIIADSPVYERGEPDQPSKKAIPRGTLQVLQKEPLRIPRTSSGRLELAEWIASKDNPLTARVFVNRVWLQLFGRGLVATTDDFGLGGRPPSHPELLDHLALRFMEDDWSIKRLIKHVVMSRVYQLSSTANEKAMKIDPDNIWLWRMAPRRLDAEALRDAMLAVSGELDTEPPVGSPIANAGEGPVSRFGFDPVTRAINDPNNSNRSIYLPMVRDSIPEVLALFDAADPNLITSERTQTTVPSQGLFLLNNAFVLRAADAAADLLAKKGSDSEKIHTAFLRFYGRSPTGDEQNAAESFLTKYRSQLAKERVPAFRRERELWSAFFQAHFASAEFQYRR